MKRGKKTSYQVPAGRKIPITKINCSKYCLCRTGIFIKHLPSRADALQNSQLVRGHGAGGSGARYPSSVLDWAELPSCPTEQVHTPTPVWAEGWNPRNTPHIPPNPVIERWISRLCKKSWIFVWLGFFYKMNCSTRFPSACGRITFCPTSTTFSWRQCKLRT